MTPMIELIERLEMATGPSRDLDADIEVAIPGRWPKRRSNARYKVVVTYEDGRTGVHSPRDYTSDIDAALTLVPDGLDYVLRSLRNNAEARVGGAKNGYMIKGGQHPTPAIALCIAALKARAALTSAERG